MSRDKYQETLTEVEKAADDIKAHVDAKVKPLQEDVFELQKTVNSRGFGTVRASGGNFRNVIPAAYRYLIERREKALPEIRERAGQVVFADPEEGAAMDLFAHLNFVREFSKIPGASGPRALVADPDKVLRDLVEAMGGLPTVNKAAWAEDAAATGGNLVPTLVERTIARLILDASVARPLCTVINVFTKTTQIPTESSAFTAYISPEATVITGGENTWSQSALVAHRYNGLGIVSNELLADSAPGIFDYVLNIIAEQIGRLQDNEVFQGDGTNCTGLSIAAGISSGTNSGTVSSGGAVPFYDDLVRAMFAAQQSVTRQGAAWAMNPLAFRYIVSMINSTGTPIFTFPSIASAVPNSLLGYPVALSSVISTRATTYTSSANIYFGPMKKIVIGDRTGIEFAVDPYSYFSSYRSQIRVLQRTGITIPTPQYFFVLKGNKY